MRRVAFIAALIGLVGCATQDPLHAYRYTGPAAPPTLGTQKPAGPGDIEKAVAGNTLVGVTRDGRRWARHIKPDGYYTAYAFLPDTAPSSGQRWSFSRGVWRAEPGRLCFRTEEARQDSCVKVVVVPGALHAYNEADGAWQFSAEVRPGNPFDL